MAKVPYVTRQVKPLLSSSRYEARIRVLNLYKDWINTIRATVAFNYIVVKTIADLKHQLRDEFLKNKDIKDLRLIDMHIIKGQLLQHEVLEKHMTCGGVLNLSKEHNTDKPTDFLSKFYSGHEP